MPTSNSTLTAELPRASPFRRVCRGVIRWVERGFAAFGLLAATYLLMFDVSTIVSPSMSPTLQGTKMSNGNHVLTEKISRWFRKPRRWEVITFFNPDGQRVMKRVAGLPGEDVQLASDGRLLINAEPVEIPPTVNQNFLRYGTLHSERPIPCGDGYYVLGDDTRDSDDSRFNGPVPADRILGRAWLIVWPRSRFGLIR